MLFSTNHAARTNRIMKGDSVQRRLARYIHWQVGVLAVVSPHCTHCTMCADRLPFD